MKFKPGDRIYFLSPDKQQRRYGIVVAHWETLWPDTVWAQWGEDKHIGWMPEKDCFLAEPRIKRNLPEWW